MSQNASRRLQPIRHVADGRAQQSARKFVDSQRVVAEAEAKLKELRGYLKEYSNVSGASLDPRMLENRRAFIARLREAEAYQAGAVERARGASRSERDRWMQHRRELQLLDRLAALYRTREHKSDEKRSQKLMDEFALRRHAQRNDDEY